MPATSLRLDDYLPYLVNRTGISLAAHFGQVLRRAGISLQDWRVLAALRERDGLRLTELAERTSIEISTLSRLVSSMEAAGLVARQKDSGDARAIALRLTPDGDALTLRLIPEALALEETALAGLDAAEAAQLKALLIRAYRNLAAAGATGDSAETAP
ncbi:MarR family transcriptional regulator [Ferrovibrio sp.]|uniref:MarR family winged helix-turn-helix transcriptional regulator n=1 Tax=Ferrovibrio sp. TaxID=1917215 RepID=UPI00311FB2DA